jgi:hypothetical protein
MLKSDIMAHETESSTGELTMPKQDKATLIRKRDELRERLERIRKDIAGGLDSDFEEQAVQLENRDALLEIARVTEEELEEVLKQLREMGE